MLWSSLDRREHRSSTSSFACHRVEQRKVSGTHPPTVCLKPPSPVVCSSGLCPSATVWVGSTPLTAASGLSRLPGRSGLPHAAFLTSASLSQWLAREPACYSHPPISLPREAMPGKNHCKTRQERPTESTSSPLPCSTTGRGEETRPRGSLQARGCDERTLIVSPQRAGRRRSTGVPAPSLVCPGTRYRRLRRRRAASDSAHSDGCPLAIAFIHLDERAGSFLPANSMFFPSAG